MERAHSYDLRVKNLRAGYSVAGKLLPTGRRMLVDGLSFEAKGGEVLGLLGANASGKTTILRAIADPNNRFGGEVFSDGEPLRPGQVAYVPQAPAGTLSPWLDARSEIALPRRVQGTPRTQWVAEVERLMNELGIWIPLDRRVEWLSGGQRVKVALLRALCVREGGRLLVMDEPFEGLDAQSRRAVIQVVRAEVARGIPVIVTSHRAEDLQFLGARMVEMVGTPVSQLAEVAGPTAISPQDETALPANKADSLEDAEIIADTEKGRRRTTAAFFGGLGFIVGLFLWTAAAAKVSHSGLLPGPVTVFQEMWHLLASPDLAPHFGATMGRALLGWVTASLVAIPLGILLGYDIRFYQAVAPWLSIARALPVFVLVAPAAGMFPNHPEVQRGFLIWLTVFVIALQAVSASAALAPRRRVDIARVFGASHWFRLTRIMPLEAISGIFTALEVTLPLSVVVCIVIETFLIPKSGLGLYIFNHLNDKDLSLLFAHILWPGVIVAVLLTVIRRLSRKFRYEL